MQNIKTIESNSKEFCELVEKQRNKSHMQDLVLNWKKILLLAEDRFDLEELINKHSELGKTLISKLISHTLNKNQFTNGEPFFTREIDNIGNQVTARTAVMHTFLQIFGDILKLFTRCKEENFMFFSTPTTGKIEEFLLKFMKESFEYSGRSPFQNESKLRAIVSWTDDPIPGVDKRICQLLFLLNLISTETYSLPSPGTLENPTKDIGFLLLRFATVLVWGIAGYLDIKLIGKAQKKANKFPDMKKKDLIALLKNQGKTDISKSLSRAKLAEMLEESISTGIIYSILTLSKCMNFIL